MIALVLAALLAPMHGVVLSAAPNGEAIVRTNDITGMLPSTTQRVRLSPRIIVRPGVGIDGFLDRSTRPWTLERPSVAAEFVPGLPDVGRAEPVDVGKPIPAATFVDQNGAPVELDKTFLGKTVLLSFIFTRCPDREICPAISGKYAYMQSRLDPARFALVEISLDPTYDSPAVLRDYGKQYGADAGRWHLLVSTGSTTQRVLDAFGINSLRVSAANYIHNDKLFIVRPDGKVAYVVDTAGWDPSGVMSEARSVAGMASNPFERFKLSLIASVAAFCGGSQFAGIVLLELSLFFIIVVLVAIGLWRVARLLWGKQT
jgi:protein SCO1/2